LSSMKFVNLKGFQDYIPLLHMQHRLVSQRHTGTLETDVALVLEHTPVFTLGRNAGRENLMVSEDFLRQRGIQVVRAERGGDITYHGPGQLVAYPILDLDNFFHSQNAKKRIKGRIIGTDGKVKKRIEEITDAYISIYGDTIAIIAPYYTMSYVKDIIEMLINGAKHSTVFNVLSKMKEEIFVYFIGHLAN